MRQPSRRYRAFLLKYGGGTIVGPQRVMELTSARRTRAWNLAEREDRELEGIDELLVIGLDGGGAAYCYDLNNRLGYGAYSIGLVYLGSFSFAWMRHVGVTFYDALEGMLSGETFFDRIPGPRESASS